jgi:3-dehydroquinate dehydratase/shikimate dehydrogenase
MNHGKICVSVCAKTADELIEQIKRAEDLADVIEIRFDELNFEQTQKLLTILKSHQFKETIPFLATFHSSVQFQFCNFANFETFKLWHQILPFEVVDWIDLDENVASEIDEPIQTDSPVLNTFFELAPKLKIVNSYHDFSETPNTLEKKYEMMVQSRAFVIKFATQADDLTDSIPIWQLLKRAKSENKEIIPIAMGESGKWTRILGLGHGAFMTYASLDSDKKTAPGQVTAQDLIEVYRAKELNENTEVYGILGSNTSVSLSPYIHNLAFKHHNLNSVFVPLQVHNLDEFILRMVKPETREIDLNFKGFSVTIPHKQSIIKHLDFIDETAKKIGAVNTVKIIDGKLYGYNTDAHGFIEPLKQVYGDLNSAKVAVLGAGGASKACVYALEQNGANVTIFDGNTVRGSEFKTRSFAEFNVFVNSTPLGMKGKFEGETPLTAEQIKNANLIYDLVYIPFQTQFMSEADQVNVPKIGGMAMLVAQALEQQKIWTGLDAPMKEISAEVLRRL